MGWYTATDCSGTKAGNAEESYIPDATIMLYACWPPAITGTISYSPDNSKGLITGSVTATLTLNITGTVTSKGRTPISATQRQKTYTSSVEEEEVDFISPVGMTGQVFVTIDWIITNGMVTSPSAGMSCA